MEELISKKKLISDLKNIKERLESAGDPFLASVITRAIGCVENQPVVLMGMDLANGGTPAVKSRRQRLNEMTDEDFAKYLLDLDMEKLGLSMCKLCPFHSAENGCENWDDPCTVAMVAYLRQEVP